MQRLVRAFDIGVLPMRPAALQLESMAHRDMKDELYDAHIEHLKQDALFQLFAYAMTGAFKEMLVTAATAATGPAATRQQTSQSAVGQPQRPPQRLYPSACPRVPSLVYEPSLRSRRLSVYKAQPMQYDAHHRASPTETTYPSMEWKGDVNREQKVIKPKSK